MRGTGKAKRLNCLSLEARGPTLIPPPYRITGLAIGYVNAIRITERRDLIYICATSTATPAP